MMGKRQMAASDKLAALDKQIAEQRTKLVELNSQRAAVEKEQRKSNNFVILNSVDTLLLFAQHSFRDCEDSRPYKNPNCPRCRLIEAKSAGYIDDNEDWTVNIQFTEVTPAE